MIDNEVARGRRLGPFRSSWLAVALLAVTAACSGPIESSGAGEPSARVEQAFDGYGVAVWRVEGSSTAPADLGPDTAQTCFLLGIGGNLDGFVSSQGNSLPAPIARVHRVNGRWLLEVGTNLPHFQFLEADVICLPTVAGRTNQKLWHTGQVDQVLAPVTASRRCFLSGVTNTDVDQPAQRSWSGLQDSVRVRSDGTNWLIGGTGQAAGWGACVDIGSNVGGFHDSSPVGSSNVDQLVSDTGDIQCALTGLTGQFFDFNSFDGVFIGHDTTHHKWTLSTTSGRGGWVDCFR